ncbi:hypothetical protein HN865_04685 [Candidatus Woesearchaeota archaeon]|jgi:uncharacterized protein with PQ loop repeat|nr:hypothetical protein [archaeon]MBT7238120.1 hypothetical protein [Candidatus Woesearchaeota archaeon]
MHEGLHHIEKRKRTEGQHEPYPSKDKLKNIIDKSIYITGLFGLVMTIPQILKIYVEQNASGISILSWIAYLFMSSSWIAYGIVHKEKPIVFTYAGWVIMKILIIIGVILYG